MRVTLLPVLLAALLLQPVPVRGQQPKMATNQAALFGAGAWSSGVFVNDVYGAYKKSYESRLPLLIFFAAEWCSYCVKMKKEALDTAEFAVMADKAVFLVLDVEKDDRLGNVKMLMTRFGITELPAFALLDASAGDKINPVGRIVGYRNAPQFMNVLSELFRPPEPLRFAAEEFPHGTLINDLPAAFVQARERRLPLVVLFAAKWCDLCRMQAETFGSREFARLTSRSVFLVLDVGTADENARKLLERLGLHEYPALAVLDDITKDNMNVRGRIVGYHGPARLMQVLPSLHPTFADLASAGPGTQDPSSTGLPIAPCPPGWSFRPGNLPRASGGNGPNPFMDSCRP
jgi:thiol:disulfide interchange protein